MKHVMIIAVILAIALSVVLAEQMLVNSIFDELQIRASECLEIIGSDESIERITELSSWWEGKRRVLYAVISHSDLKDVDFRFPLIIEYLKRGNVEDGAAELSAIILLAETVPATYRLAIENIL